MQEMIHIKYMLEDEVAGRRRKMLMVKVGFQAKLATLRNKAKQFMTCEKLYGWIERDINDLFDKELKRRGLGTCEHYNAALSKELQAEKRKFRRFLMEEAEKIVRNHHNKICLKKKIDLK